MAKNIFDTWTVADLLNEARLLTISTCPDGHFQYNFKITGILTSACTGVDSPVKSVLHQAALLCAISQNKSPWLALFGTFRTYFFYPSKEIIVCDNWDSAYHYHQNFYEFAYQYNRRHKNFGEFKSLILELDDPFYEAWLLGRILGKK